MATVFHVRLDGIFKEIKENFRRKEQIKAAIFLTHFSPMSHFYTP